MACPARGNTRQRIVSATAELLAEVGYHGMRLHQVARRVGIRKSSLFHHFASKEALYRAALEEGARDGEDVLRSVAAPSRRPADRVRALVEAYVEEVGRNADRIRVLARHALGDAPPGVEAPEMPPLLAALIEAVREGRERGELAPIDEAALAVSVVGMVAFLLAAAPVLYPWLAIDGHSPQAIARVKRHVVAMVERSLAPASASSEAASGCVTARLAAEASVA
jgi:AcrR family transcriptional regulator